MVDDDDYEVLKDMYFYKSGRYYFCQVGDDNRVPIHRFIMNAPDNMRVDHINGITFDNRKSNLRLATNSQNSQNKGMRKDNTTGYKGVCFDKEAKKYQASIRYNGKKIYLGKYDNPVDAALAYNEAAEKYFGEFARINIIERDSL